MKPQEVVARLSQAMDQAGLEETRLQAEVLVMHVLGLSRARLYAAWGDTLVTPTQWQTLRALLKRRLGREPLAYIVGRQEFFGLEFVVDCRVLIPRPETELLVEQALQSALTRHHRGRCAIADVGTGSGAMAIALGVYLPEATLYATDISAEALAVARENCCRHGLEERVVLLQGDLLTPLAQPLDLVVSNPPYVRDSDMPLRDRELEQEPEVAFRGGPRGLDVVARLLCQAPVKLAAGATLLIEVGPSQAAAAQKLARRAFPGARVDLVKDLSGWERILLVQT